MKKTAMNLFSTIIKFVSLIFIASIGTLIGLFGTALILICMPFARSRLNQTREDKKAQQSGGQVYEGYCERINQDDK